MKNAIRLLGLLFMALLFACGYAQPSPTSSEAKGFESGATPASENKSKPYVLHSDQGEVLMDGQGRKNIIKVSPETGAAHLTMGTTEMPKGSGILVHKHDKMEEILYVHHGNGTAVIDGDSVQISAGATLFIPPGTWHGVNNPDDSMTILHVVTPQGLEQLFRGFGSPPGAPLKKLTPQQIDSIEVICDSKAKGN